MRHPPASIILPHNNPYPLQSQNVFTTPGTMHFRHATSVIHTTTTLSQKPLNYVILTTITNNHPPKLPLLELTLPKTFIHLSRHRAYLIHVGVFKVATTQYIFILSSKLPCTYNLHLHSSHHQAVMPPFSHSHEHNNQEPPHLTTMRHL